jgi:hypothetical protein
MAHKKGPAATEPSFQNYLGHIMAPKETAFVDWAEFERFLVLLGRGDVDNKIVISVFPADPGKPNIHIPCLAGSIPKPRIQALLARGQGLSLGLVINPALPQPGDWGEKPEHFNPYGERRAWGASNAHIAGARWIWYEADGGLSHEKQLAAIHRAGLPEPDLIVDTGGKSLHCYWRLDEQITPDQFRDFQQRLQQGIDAKTPEMGGDPSIHNPCRVMRAPGGLHPATGRRCTIWRPAA